MGPEPRFAFLQPAHLPWHSAVQNVCKLASNRGYVYPMGPYGWKWTQIEIQQSNMPQHHFTT